MPNTFIDPVVSEVHLVRQYMLATAGGDVEVMMQRVAERQDRSSHAVIRVPLPNREEESGSSCLTSAVPDGHSRSAVE